MKVYQVVYDLKKPGQNYSGLIEALKQSPLWARPTESTWLIKTSESPKEVHERLSRHLDSSDLILIIEVHANYSGMLNPKIWEWLSANLG